MKKPLIAAFILVDMLLFGLLGFIFIQPDVYKVERAVVVKAPAHIVFTYLNDYQKWNEWSPWSKRDPNLKAIYEGPAQGKGAVYKWAGNDDVGTGQMTIVDSVLNQKVVHELRFMTPFESTAKTQFDLVKEDNLTKIVWSMKGENDFMGKAFSLVMNMEDMIGKDYEEGLANLKPLVEKAAAETVEGRAKAAAQAVGDAANDVLHKVGELMGNKKHDDNEQNALDVKNEAERPAL